MNMTGKYVKHGLTHSKIRNIWRHMLRRCYDQKHKNYKQYGGRGIKVCDRWRDLQLFFMDMGHPPGGMLLDRINNDGDYEPSNCRWTTCAVQQRNRRSNRVLEYQGERKVLTDWAKKFGLRDGCLTHRLNAGWPLDRALTTPVQKRAR